MQDVGIKQHELNINQRELRKAQQLLRQLERQLAKSHMSRKDSAVTLKQIQVRTETPVLPSCFMPITRMLTTGQ